MEKRNCWEFKQCGREPGGKKAEELGVCPASTDGRLDSVHGGKNAGRACWVLAGTLCGGKPQGTYANKYKSCQLCDFYHKVKDEEKMDFQLSIVLLRRLQTGLVPVGQ
jgi:hypothetical protein